MWEARNAGRARLLWATCAALVAHAVAYACVAHLEVRSSSALRIHQVQPQREVEIDDVTSESSTPAPASAEVAPSASRPERVHGMPEARGTRPTDASSAPEPTVPTASSGDSSWTFSPTTSGSAQSGGPLAGNSLDAAVHAGIDATLAQDREADARRSRTIPVFTPREIELGLAPGGVLRSLGRDIARRSRVPDGSRARLQFDTNAAGVVVAFRVLDASSAWPEWEEVAQGIATASREKPPMRVPPGWRGLAITLDVSCELRTVEGKTSRDLFDKATHLPMLRIAEARLVDTTVF